VDDILDVLIIGGGQFGLSMGQALTEAGLSFLILEREKSIGARWRRHYDSLELFTPRRYSALPNLPMQGDQEGYPTKDEYADYLETYAVCFKLPIVLGAKVKSLTKADGLFRVKAGRKIYTARQVVLAVGYQRPRALETDGSIPSLHSSDYKNPSQVKGKRVLIVGGGNSGAQIAVELSKSHEVSVSLKDKLRTIERTYLGKSFYYWGELLRAHKIPSDSFIGRVIKSDKDFVVGSEFAKLLKKGAIRKKPALLRIRHGRAVFSNGASDLYDMVIFATGFSGDYSFVAIDGALGKEGEILHTKGVSPVEGLYVTGLRNMLTYVSHNIAGTHINTPYLLGHIQAEHARISPSRSSLC
jgi:putative flavoprotein involved in K+ transport